MTTLDAADLAHLFFVGRAAGAGGELLFHRAQLFLEFFFAREQFFEALDRGAVARAELRADLFENFLALANRFERALSGHRFDSADARRDSRFRFELEHPDVAGARDVRAAA